MLSGNLQCLKVLLQYCGNRSLLQCCSNALRHCGIAAMRTAYCSNGPIAAILQQRGIAAILRQCSRNCNVATTLRQCPLQGIAAILRQQGALRQCLLVLPQHPNIFQMWELILHSLHHLYHLHCELRLAMRSTGPPGVCQNWLTRRLWVRKYLFFFLPFVTFSSSLCLLSFIQMGSLKHKMCLCVLTTSSTSIERTSVTPQSNLLSTIHSLSTQTLFAPFFNPFFQFAFIPVLFIST